MNSSSAGKRGTKKKGHQGYHKKTYRGYSIDVKQKSVQQVLSLTGPTTRGKEEGKKSEQATTTNLEGTNEEIKGGKQEEIANEGEWSTTRK